MGRPYLMRSLQSVARRRLATLVCWVSVITLAAGCGSGSNGAGAGQAEEQVLLGHYQTVVQVVVGDPAGASAAGVPTSLAALARTVRGLAGDPTGGAALEYVALIDVTGRGTVDPQPDAAKALGCITAALLVGTRSSAPINGLPLFLTSIGQRSPGLSYDKASNAYSATVSPATSLAVEQDAASAATDEAGQVMTTKTAVARETTASSLLEKEETFVNTVVSPVSALEDVRSAVNAGTYLCGMALGVPNPQG